MPRPGSAGRQRVSYENATYAVPTDEELALVGVAGRLAEARAILDAVIADAKVAVASAAAAGMPDRAIARAVGVHRATVRNWKREAQP